MRKGVKITVLNKLNKDEILDDEIAKLTTSTAECDLFQVGQEFTVDENGNMPTGFCSFAWDDIWAKYIFPLLNLDAHFPWVTEKGKIVVCCTDGFRPVIFKLETI